MCRRLLTWLVAYGNTFPGAAVPFGMVQPSPTTYRAGKAQVGEKGGYEYTASLIRGCGMTCYSGTGCTGRYGGYEFPTIPYASSLVDGVLPVNPSVDVKGTGFRTAGGSTCRTSRRGACPFWAWPRTARPREQRRSATPTAPPSR